LAAGRASAGGQEFDFKDPKGVNAISFVLDSLLEPIMGVASGIAGTVKFDPADPKATTGRIAVEAASLHTPNKGMTDALLGPDWLDVKNNARIEFTFKKVTEAKTLEPNVFEMTVVGDVACKGVTKETTAVVKATFLPGKLGERTSRQTGDLLILRSTFTIQRSDHQINPGTPATIVAEEIQLRVAIAGAAPKK
jgi:polyisoprenoid-binding protein YceI